jgi:Tfp pilus assembly PilM family ATPase
MSTFSLSLAAAAGPLAAVGLSGGRISALSVELRGGSPVIAAYASEALPPDALVPSLTAANIRDRAVVGAALSRVLAKIGKPKRIGLVVADPVAKVSLVKLQQVPVRPQELHQVIRWQIRKSAPFAIEDAQVGYDRGRRDGDGQEFVVTLARRDVIEDYEALCQEAGAHAGVVDLATFNVVNAVLSSRAGAAGDWLLVNVAPDWASIAILRGPDLIFFRTRGADGEGTLADLVHQTAMYYEDRLSGAGFQRVLLSGGANLDDIDPVRRNLADRLSTPIESVDPTGAASLADRISVPPAMLDWLAPLVGMVLRSREAAA